MIRAAILPYAREPGGACCVVVVHDGPAVLAREDIPVGYLDTVGGRITRIVGPPEVAAVVARVVEIVGARRVERSRVEWPSGDGVEATRAKVIAAGINAALGAWWPEVVAIVAAAPGDIAARLRALMEDEGPGVGGETSSPAPAKPSTASPDPTPAPPPAQAPKAGRRVLAVDPGSRHVAAVVLEALRVVGVGGIAKPHDTMPLFPRESMVSMQTGGVGEPQHERSEVVHTTHPTTFARYVASLSLTIGRDVPLRRPKVITRKDGTVITKTTRHEVTDEDLDELLRTLARFALEHDVDEAAVEVATFAHKGAGAFLLRSNEIGGEVRGWLRAAGLQVRRVSSKTWRKSARKVAGLRPQTQDLDRVEVGHVRDLVVAPDQPVVHGVIHAPWVKGSIAHVGGDVRGSAAAVASLGEQNPGVLVGFVAGAKSAVAVGAVGKHGAQSITRAGGDKDKWAHNAVRALVADLPPDADTHILDASGAALWVLAPEPAPEVAPPAKPRAPRAQGGGKASVWTPEKAEQRRRARDAAKLARGCIGCVGQHHQATCPIEVARLAKVAPSMRGNQNAARGAKV